MMVIAEIAASKSQNHAPDHCLVGVPNYKNPNQSSKITMTSVSRNQMQDSSSATWPNCRQSYGSHPVGHENGHNDWPTIIGCDTSHWSTGQRYYAGQDHQRQPIQDEGNFHDYIQAKYLNPNTSYSDGLKLVNGNKFDETTPRQVPYRVPVDNQQANHQHNYYNPITVNHVHVNYNATDAYNPTNQHRIYHMDHTCNRYQHNPIYSHDNHGCNRSGPVLIGGPVATSELTPTISSPSSGSLYHSQHGHQNYVPQIRANSQTETSRISFADSNKCRQQVISEQPYGTWINQTQHHDYTPQFGSDKLPESINHQVNHHANNHQVRAPLRVTPLYECPDGVYDYYKPELSSNTAYPQDSTNTMTTNCDQTYGSSSTLPTATDCPSRGSNEIQTFVVTTDSKLDQPLDKLDSKRSGSGTDLTGSYPGIEQIQTSAQPQQQQTSIERTQHESKTGITSKATSRAQYPADRLNQCRICGRNYARPSTLKTHLRTHTNERPYKCAICRKTFSQAANLTAHQRVHTGERPFPCPICGRQFSQSSSVITHLRTHSGERPYRCAMCNRRFSDSSTLTKHCRIHSGEKPYQCDYCPMNFSQSGNLSRHLRLHLMGGLSKTAATSAAATSAVVGGSDLSARNVRADNVVETDSSSLAMTSKTAAANQRRHSTNLSNSSPESTLSSLI